jgi:hypothetical protein
MFRRLVIGDATRPSHLVMALRDVPRVTDLVTCPPWLDFSKHTEHSCIIDSALLALSMIHACDIDLDLNIRHIMFKDTSHRPRVSSSITTVLGPSLKILKDELKQGSLLYAEPELVAVINRYLYPEDTGKVIFDPYCGQALVADTWKNNSFIGIDSDREVVETAAKRMSSLGLDVHVLDLLS